MDDIVVRPPVPFAACEPVCQRRIFGKRMAHTLWIGRGLPEELLLTRKCLSEECRYEICCHSPDNQSCEQDVAVGPCRNGGL